MKKNNGTGMDPFQKFVKSLFFCGLIILIPIHISKAPEKGLIAEIFRHL